LAGLWLTAYPGMWRRLIRLSRTNNRYGYSFHFHEISRNPEDWQYKAVREVFRSLTDLQRSWYARVIHVPTGNPIEADISLQEVYDIVVGSLIYRFAGRAKSNELRIVLSHRNRAGDSEFLPKGIQRLANMRSKMIDGPRITVEVKPHRSDDLLQLADLVMSSVRQVYYPSPNPNKEQLAETAKSLIGTRIKVWRLNTLDVG
jgi:hypothetical protein